MKRSDRDEEVSSVPHDEFAPTEFAPTSTELDRVRPQPDRVRPQTDCVPFHVSEVLNSIVNSIDMKVDQTLACSSQLYLLRLPKEANSRFEHETYIDWNGSSKHLVTL